MQVRYSRQSSRNTSQVVMEVCKPLANSWRNARPPSATSRRPARECHPAYDWSGSCANNCRPGRMTNKGEKWRELGAQTSRWITRIRCVQKEFIRTTGHVRFHTDMFCQFANPLRRCVCVRKLVNSQATPDFLHRAMPKLVPAAINARGPLTAPHPVE